MFRLSFWCSPFPQLYHQYFAFQWNFRFLWLCNTLHWLYYYIILQWSVDGWMEFRVRPSPVSRFCGVLFFLLCIYIKSHKIINFIRTSIENSCSFMSKLWQRMLIWGAKGRGMNCFAQFVTVKIKSSKNGQY